MSTDYSTLNNTQLKKLMTEKKINGRSKITKKKDMIDALTAFDNGETINVPEKEKKPRVPKLNSEDVKKLLTEALLEFELNISDNKSEEWQLFKEKLMKATEVSTKKKAPRKKKEDGQVKSRKSKKSKEDSQDSESDKEEKKKKKDEKKEEEKKKKEEEKKKKEEEKKKKEEEKKKKEEKKEEEKKKKESATEKMIEVIAKTPQKRITSKDLVIKDVTKPSDVSKYSVASISQLKEMMEERGLNNTLTSKYDMIKALVTDDLIKNMKIKTENNNQETSDEEMSENEEPQEE
jgi:hypothetical protein